MDYANFCKKILEIDPKIRYVAVCDLYSEIQYDIQRPGVRNLLTREETKLSLSQAILRWSTRRSLENKIGKAKYAMAEYEKIIRVTMPIDDSHILFMSTEVDADIRKIISDVTNLVSPSR